MARSNTDADPFETDDPREPPAFTPERFDAPAYEDITTDDDLIAYNRAYLGVVLAYYDLEVDASHIEQWEVTDRAKRRATSSSEAGSTTPKASISG
jgi:hypothetical protein